IAQENGYKDIKHYFDVRKTGKYRKFERYARDAGKPLGLGSKFEKMYKEYSDSGFERGETEYRLLYELDLVTEADYDKYTED
ncbi:hypothetical protein L0244_10360, partial [bacterium]|nr:hypothetical protein [bacterium]